MNKVLEQDINKKISNVIKSDLNKYLVDKKQINEDQKRIWFKGCRYR